MNFANWLGPINLAFAKKLTLFFEMASMIDDHREAEERDPPCDQIDAEEQTKDEHPTRSNRRKVPQELVAEQERRVKSELGKPNRIRKRLLPFIEQDEQEQRLEDDRYRNQ